MKRITELYRSIVYNKMTNQNFPRQIYKRIEPEIVRQLTQTFFKKSSFIWSKVVTVKRLLHWLARFIFARHNLTTCFTTAVWQDLELD